MNALWDADAPLTAAERASIMRGVDKVYTTFTNDVAEGRNLPIEHCIEGTHGWQLNDAVAKAAEKATVIDKPTFGSNRLAGILMTERAQEALEIELVGLCTDICVVSNALLFKAAMPEAPITVDASCCAGVTPESHRHALETMKMCQIKVVND